MSTIEQITEDQIKKFAPSANPVIVKGIIDGQSFIIKGGIDTPLRLCHFMAQVAQESDGLRVTLEYASGEAYEGRSDLGNTVPGDGTRYRGRGLIQTTGRANYQAARDAIRKLDPAAPDFEADPVQLESFPWALLSAIVYWQSRGINRYADQDNVTAVTRAVNGGTNGLIGRAAYLARAKEIFMQPKPIQKTDQVRAALMQIQTALRDAGLYQGAIDGIFGPMTSDALTAYQRPS